MNTTLLNPVTSFIDAFVDMDLKSRVYATRPIMGTLNASIIGAVLAHITKTFPAEGSGIDGLNDSLSAKLATLANIEQTIIAADREPQIAPYDTAACLLAIREEIMSRFAFPDVIVDEISNPKSTFDFMARGRQVSPQTLRQLATALGMTEGDVEEAAKAAFASSGERLINNRLLIFGEIREILDMHDREGQSAFEELPSRVKAKLTVALKKSVDRQLGLAMQNVMSGNADRITDVAELRRTQVAIAEWAKNESKTSGDFALAYAA